MPARWSMGRGPGPSLGAKPFVVFYKHGKITSVSYDNTVDAGLCSKWHAAGYYE